MAVGFGPVPVPVPCIPLRTARHATHHWHGATRLQWAGPWQSSPDPLCYHDTVTKQRPQVAAMASRPKRASSMESEPEEFAFKARISVYGLAQEQQKAIRKKLLLHRLVFLAKISPELADKQDLAGYWHLLFLSLQRYYQGEGVTGLLLLYPTYLVHTLEASSEVLYSVLRDLRDMQPQKHRALILEPKILVLSHNIPSRLFQQWSYKVLDVPSRHLGYNTLREEPIETIIGECLAMLLKLGEHLLKYPKSSPNLPDAVLEKVPNLIISQDTICHLLECRELLSPAQFLQTYDSPLNVVMDSGHVFGSENPYAVACVATAREGEAGRHELMNGKESGPMDVWGTAEMGGL
ncbi:unnamed protein product [Caretta caretta]